MQIFHDLNDWLSVRNKLAPELSLGFVPTMGNLHAGHVSLYNKAKEENDCIIASIFVNPTQFNRADDFSNYPRTLATDLNLLEQAGVDYCLLPTEQAIYADGYRYQLLETELCQLMEGKHRPGHFTGVLTIVMKLLNLVRAQRAYFGEKDYQQYLLIRDMATAFFMNVEIKACPTIRETSGLAYSSRNNRLSASQRLEAEKFARIFHQDKTCEQLIKELEHQGITVEYIEEFAKRRFAAVMIGDIRLIDNYALDL
ncbi:Pantothenate synthetase [Legionella massiliensis]|uniref:Pantothenate synthetase n=1 Tax=Legionella massiliensis TaxID=1034943 RepID=A0A078KSJ4_9GAMM|nr:pantoate--beta-alanine ligase [Legionella massiliensis]CDZ75907.1 Pantothenate synthetase [Legionella massiliensis]CEE11645.1 Pantothenate synthetase [Legionella massiliensis]